MHNGTYYVLTKNKNYKNYFVCSENKEVAAASSLTPILISVLLVILLSGFLALFFWKRSKKIKVKKDMKAKIHTLRNLDKEPVR